MEFIVKLFSSRLPVFRIEPVNRMDSAELFQLSHRLIKFLLIVYVNLDAALKQAFFRFYGKGIDIDPQFVV